MSITLPYTNVPTEPYRRPDAVRPDSLRLDGNEGRWPSAELLATVADLGTRILRDYPDPSSLVDRIADRHGVGADAVVLTAGADDGLDRACRSFLSDGREIVLPVPTFEMMHRFTAVAGGRAVEVPWAGAFPVGAVIGAIGPSTSLVAMVTPNNPTGDVATADDLRRVAEAAGNRLVLLDHIYVEYADEDLTPIAVDLENVIVFRTFSKAWGLAGCRVGYALARPDVASVLRSAGNPYPVSALSAAVVSAQIERGDAPIREHARRVCVERDRLRTFLSGAGIATRPSQGNFVFADFGPRVERVYRGLAERGVLVRFFPHRAEIATGLRISLPGTDRDFARLLSALQDVLMEEDA